MTQEMPTVEGLLTLAHLKDPGVAKKGLLAIYPTSESTQGLISKELAERLWSQVYEYTKARGLGKVRHVLEIISFVFCEEFCTKTNVGHMREIFQELDRKVKAPNLNHPFIAKALYGNFLKIIDDFLEFCSDSKVMKEAIELLGPELVKLFVNAKNTTLDSVLIRTKTAECILGCLDKPGKISFCTLQIAFILFQNILS